jgi:hypothetical protein
MPFGLLRPLLFSSLVFLGSQKQIAIRGCLRTEADFQPPSISFLPCFGKGIFLFLYKKYVIIYIINNLLNIYKGEK